MVTTFMKVCTLIFVVDKVFWLAQFNTNILIVSGRNFDAQAAF